MSFRRRNYPEIMDNVLTRLIGGVAAESHAFPPAQQNAAPYIIPLEQQPVLDVTSVYGLRNGGSHQFVKDVDFALGADKQSMTWLEGGALPDAGTTFEVNYTLKSSQGVANDLYIGSVVRTLAESASYEMATLYAQMESVYKAGFIDTASGPALNNVVSLLGVSRIKAGRNTVKLRFTRSKGSQGNISIPAGTRVLTTDGAIEYATIDDITMLNGQSVIVGAARDLVETNDGVPAGALVVIATPIAGIDAVTNTEASTTLDRDENDDELRTRAKNFLHGSERSTLGAIQHAIARQQILADVTEDAPGIINIAFHSGDLAPDQKDRLEKAVDDVRPAGIKVNYLYADAPQAVDLELRLTTVPGLLETDLKRVQDTIQSQVADYFAKLPTKSAGSVNQLVGIALGQAEVQDVRILSATAAENDVLDRENGVLAIEGVPTVLGQLTITDPSLPTQLLIIVRFPDDQAPADSSAITGAVTEMVSYINEYNAQETVANDQQRELSFGKFLYVLPLPGHDGKTLFIYDTQFGTVDEAALPTGASRAPYSVEIVLTSTTGISTLLNDDAAPAYNLTPFERLTFAGVEISAETSDG